MKVADLTVDQFRELIREVVGEVLAEHDDDGELNPDFEAELHRRIAEGGAVYDEAHVRKELGI